MVEFLEGGMQDWLIAMLILLGIGNVILLVNVACVLKDVRDLLKKPQKECNEAMSHSQKRIDHLYQICIDMLGTRHKG